MATVILGIGMTVLDATMVNLALPGIVRDLQVSEADVVWLVNAYQLAILVSLLPLAMVGDLFGYRKVYLGGVALFALAGVVCVSARSLEQLLLARALQGAGAAGLFAVNAALVRAIYPRHLLGQGIAINSAVVATASVAGPALAAAILSGLPWPWLFGANIPLALGVLVLGWYRLPATPRPPGSAARIPLFDVVLNAAMFLLLFLGIERLVPRRGVAAPALAAALILAGILVAVVYVRRQRRQQQPLLPVDLLRIPVFRLSMGTSIAAFAAHTLASVALPFLLLEGLRRSPAEAGWVLAAWPLGTIALAPVAGRLIGRWPSGLLGGIGLVLLALGLALMAWRPEHASMPELAWRLALCGAGFGLFQAPNNHTIVTSAPPHRAGAAGGLLSTARLTGQSVGALVLGALFSLRAGQADEVPTLALLIAAAFALGGSISSLLRLRGTGSAG